MYNTAKPFFSLPYPTLHLSFSSFIYFPYFLFCLSLISFLLALTLIILKFYIFKSLLKKEYTLLEIITPDDSNQSPFSTEQLFASIHSIGSSLSFPDAVLKRKRIFSLEIVATSEKGIRFLLYANKNDADIIKKNIISYLTYAQVKEVDDYLPSFEAYKTNTPHTVEIKLSNHFAYPLQRQTVLKEHDPIAYITGHMTQLHPGDVMAVQLCTTPLVKSIHRKEFGIIGHILWLMRKGLDITPAIKGGIFKMEYILPILFSIPVLFYIYFSLLTPNLRLIVNIIGFIIIVGAWFLWNPTKLKKEKELSREQTEVQEEIAKKITDNLFETSIRLYFHEGKPGSMSGRVQGLLTAFTSSTRTRLQSLVIKRKINLFEKLPLVQNYTYFLFKNRIISYKSTPILSVAEVASLYHFPFTLTTKTQDLAHVKSPVLPLPLTVKTNKEQFAITFAQNSYGDTKIPIGLTQKEREKHMYILGATGTGKTTLLKTMIMQDIQNGNGTAVIDPHGDLIEDILAAIPQERIKDVVYFNPADREYPVGINFLEIPQYLTKDEADMEKDIITSNLISVFSKISSAKAWGPRMEHILRNATLTALSTENPSVITIHRLLLDYQYRKGIVEKLIDPVLKMFWQKEFVALGSYQRAEAIAPIVNKLGRFLTSPISRNILGQTTSKIDFSDIMDNKKILLCNLSKGKIGEDISMLFGALITAKLQLAALRRSNIAEEKRTDFYLYIDEFQNFATSSFAQIMSESRKYHLYAILAHQTTAQIEDKNLIKVILSNTGILLTFRTASPFDEDFVLPNFAPQVAKGDIANLPSFNFYMKLQVTTPQNAFSGETMRLETKEDMAIKDDVITSSREFYTTPREQIEKEITEALTYAEEQPKQKQTRRKKRAPIQPPVS